MLSSARKQRRLRHCRRSSNRVCLTPVARIEAYLATEDHHRHPPSQAAVDAVAYMAARYDLHVVSGRAKNLEAVTRQVLDRYFPDTFRSVIFTNKYHAKGLTKVEAAQQLGADVLIDDDLAYACDAASRGITALLFGTYPWNDADELPAQVQRVRDWNEILTVL